MTDLPASVRWQLWIVAFGFFMQSLDTTIVNTALPSMAKSLGESPLHMHMIYRLLCVNGGGDAAGQRLAGRPGRGAQYLLHRHRAVYRRIAVLRPGQHPRPAGDGAGAAGVGGAMMVPVGRLTVMKIVPRDQYMAAMTFVTLPGQVGPLLGPALGGVLVEYASWHWIFLINIPVGGSSALSPPLCLMPNYTMQTRRFDLSGFLLLAAGMATLTLALDGQKGLGISPAWLAGLVAVGLCALLLYLWHARGNARALFSLNLFRNRTFSLGLGGSFAGRIGSGMLPFMTPVFLQIGLGFSPFHAGLMMIPMVLGSMGSEADRGPGGQPLWLPSGAGRAAPWAWRRSACCLCLAPWPGGITRCRWSCFCRDDQRQPLLLNEYPDAERSPGRSGQQRQQPAVDGDAAVDEYRRDHRRAAAGAVWPAAYEPRRRQHPSGLSLHLSEHGGDHRPAGAHLFPGTG